MMKLIVGLVFGAASIAFMGQPATANTLRSYKCDSSGCSGQSLANFDLVSNSSKTGGVFASGLELDISGPFSVNDLTNLSANYNMVKGAFGGGSPRFTLEDTSGNALDSAYIYFGNTGGGKFSNPYANGISGDTGNYADLASSDLRIESAGFGGYTSGTASYITFADFASHVGSINIGYIYLDLDGGFTGDQELSVNSLTLNGTTYQSRSVPVPEPSTLPLFGAGLAGMVGLCFMRGRKAKAA